MHIAQAFLYHVYTYSATLLRLVLTPWNTSALVVSYITKVAETRSQAPRDELEEWHEAHLSFCCQWH